MIAPLSRAEKRVVGNLLDALISGSEEWQRVIAWDRWSPELIDAAGNPLRYSQLLTLIAEGLATHMHSRRNNAAA